jgi:putative transposase
VSQKRIARRLQVLGRRGFRPRAWVRWTTPDPTRVPAPNLLARDVTVGAPDSVWSADITYLPTHEGIPYPAVVPDVGTRRVVSRAMRPTLEDDLVVAALDAALATRRGRPTLHHSDFRGQYTGRAHRELLSHLESRTLHAARVRHFTEAWYDPVRLHSSLGYRSPDAYERDYWRLHAAS